MAQNFANIPKQNNPSLVTAENIALVRKLGAYVALSDKEISVLNKLNQPQKQFSSGMDLMHEGQTNHTAFILSEGWVSSYKLLPTGSRQIVDIQIPGDFVGMRSILLRAADYNVEPITPIKASALDLADLLDVFRQCPRIAEATLWASSSDEAAVVERLVSLGRRPAVIRVAHFLLELCARLMLVGCGTQEGFACPLTQYHLADALGLSAVHVNRVLRQLREKGLLTFRDGFVSIDDIDRLTVFADFDTAYLDYRTPVST